MATPNQEDKMIVLIGQSICMTSEVVRFLGFTMEKIMNLTNSIFKCCATFNVIVFEVFKNLSK